MKFLTKLGQILNTATQIALGFEPIAKMAYPGHDGVINTVSNDIAEMAGIVVQTEVLGQALKLPGPDKLKAAAPLVAQIVLRSSIVANHKIANPALFQQGCTKMTDGLADILNALEDKVETTSKV